MSTTDAPVFFDHCRAAIHELLVANVDMRVVEHTIDAYALERDDKDALWLWAIGRRERLVGNRSDFLLVDGEPRNATRWPSTPVTSEGDGYDHVR